jgi:UPF0755 protein
MAKQKSRPILVVILFLIIITCILGAFAWLGLIYVPQRAVAVFGPSSPSLSLQDKTLYAAQLLWNQDSVLKPLNQDTYKRDFSIEFGESVPQIAERLRAELFISNPDLFSKYLVFRGLDASIQAGDYQLSASMNIPEIAAQLQDATPATIQFAILPGWRLEEITNALPTSGLEISQERFLTTALYPEGLYLPPSWERPATLEGYLFPGSYQFPREIGLQDMLIIVTQKFEAEVNTSMRERFAEQGLTLHQAVILASIIEREAMNVEEQPMIASVFLNRLASGMRLESDPTVQYAIGYDEINSTWWKNPLTYADLEVVSAYNTYQVEGLPPGPICNPSLSALQSVAYPAQTPYYYFRAACDQSGNHTFAVTFEEHLQNGCP